MCYADNAIPVLDCPSHIGEVTETNGAVVDVIVTAYDDVDGHVNSTCWIAENEVVPGYIFPVGDSMVTCTAMDAAGNTALCNILITVSGEYIVLGEDTLVCKYCVVT